MCHSDRSASWRRAEESLSVKSAENFGDKGFLGYARNDKLQTEGSYWPVIDRHGTITNTVLFNEQFNDTIYHYKSKYRDYGDSNRAKPLQ